MQPAMHVGHAYAVRAAIEHDDDKNDREGTVFFFQIN